MFMQGDDLFREQAAQETPFSYLPCIFELPSLRNLMFRLATLNPKPSCASFFHTRNPNLEALGQYFFVDVASQLRNS